MFQLSKLFKANLVTVESHGCSISYINAEKIGGSDDECKLESTRIVYSIKT